MKNLKIFFLVMTLVLGLDRLQAQYNLSSPSNWLYPNGNSEATKKQIISSAPQEIDSFKVKWSTSAISGDVQPLIGNIINDPKVYSGFSYAPNEIVAVMAGKIVVVDAKGATHKVSNQFYPYIKNVSCLIDTNSLGIGSHKTVPLLMGIETLEFENKKDSLGYAYIAGFDNIADTVKFLKRLAIDLRLYKPNIFSSIKPVYAKRTNGDIMVYATINMSKPTIDDPNAALPPFLRGFTQFNLGPKVGSYPMPDAGDDVDNRIHFGPEVGFFQPSITLNYGSKESILLSTTPDVEVNMMINNNVTTIPTFTDRSYLLGFDITKKNINEDAAAFDMNNIFIPDPTKKPYIKSYHIKLAGTGLPDSNLILVAEEYSGIGKSTGKSKLHLFDPLGDPITDPESFTNPSFNGSLNHEWSVAVGNVDGNPTNEWLPYYPNNNGDEIIVTQSSRDFAFPASKVMVLRYLDGNNIDKPSPPGTYLFPFDTICTQRINGWVAAVNDIDGAPNGKSEIVLVDGNILRVLRLRDYQSEEYKRGTPFDTVYQTRFPQTISNVAIADLEGDGKNDMIVTTFDSTYVIGMSFINTIIADYPKFITDYEVCVGDTLPIKWINVMKSSGGVSLKFREYINNIPQDTLYSLAPAIINDKDTITFKYTVENHLAGKTGKVIITNTDNKQIKDSTSFIKINKPSYTITSASIPILYVGEDIFINGTASCTDSARIQISFDDSTWTTLWTTKIDSIGKFALRGVVPCPSYLRCDSLQKDSLLFARLLSFKSSYVDTSSKYMFRLYPERVKYTLDTNRTADPSKTFRWNSLDLKANCDSLSILMSIDNGISYNLLENVAVEDQKYVWLVPLNLPNDLKFRLCCNTCMQSDTALSNYLPTYIQIVAPNPFKPPYEQAEIIYSVNEETNVNIKILDQADRIVAEVVKSQLRKPEIAYADKWDGLRWDGSPCDSGMYYILMEFSNGKREVYPIFVRK
jgi:hypothetical protein